MRMVRRVIWPREGASGVGWMKLVVCGFQPRPGWAAVTDVCGASLEGDQRPIQKDWWLLEGKEEGGGISLPWSKKAPSLLDMILSFDYFTLLLSLYIKNKWIYFCCHMFYAEKPWFLVTEDKMHLDSSLSWRQFLILQDLCRLFFLCGSLLPLM